MKRREPEPDAACSARTNRSVASQSLIWPRQFWIVLRLARRAASSGP